MAESACALCQRQVLLTFHHLIPRTCHKNKWFQKRFTREYMATTGIYVCRLCHNFIHKQYDEKTLGRDFNCVEKLKLDAPIQRFVNWVKKQK